MYVYYFFLAIKIQFNFHKKVFIRIFELNLRSYSRYSLQSYTPNNGIQGFSLLSGLWHQVEFHKLIIKLTHTNQQ